MTTNQSLKGNDIDGNRIFKGILYVTAVLITILLSGFSIFVAAQSAHKTENTRNKPDQTLRSNARINPGTLAMELSIPIADFPGRAGLGMPLVFNYSSKLWRLDLIGYGESTIKYTTNAARYAEKSAAGWTSSFGTAQIEAFPDLYDCHGNPVGEISMHVPPPARGDVESGGVDGSNYCGDGLYYMTRIRVKLPDGSTQELRKDDSYHSVVNEAIEWEGTYLATDGSRSRLEMGETSSILYLPDGARYYFQIPPGGTEQIGYLYEDRHGNRLNFNVSTRTWTDTLARSLTSPLPLNPATQEQSAGTQTFSMPGLAGEAAREYKLVWKNLGDANVLLDSNEALAYDGNRDCPSGNVYNGSESLFMGSLQTRVCRAGIFNPVVLTEIALPNQLKYKFQYNRYGEITKIEYPTGGSERFEYAAIPSLSIRSDAVHEHTNRGVVNRWVSDLSGAPEMHWKYEPFKELGGTRYRVKTTAPDGLTITEQYLESNWSNGIQQNRTLWGFENPLSGRAYEERVYSGTTLKTRKLTEWEYTGAIGGSYLEATRDPRVKREIFVVFEPGSSYALVTKTENTYDTSGSTDLRAFSSLNLKTSEQYDFILVEAGSSASPAQTENAAQLAARFNNIVPVKRSELDYLYNTNYNSPDTSLLGIVIEQRVINPANNNQIVSRAQMRYDEFTLTSSANLPTFAAGRWVDPNNAYRGNLTSIRSYTDPADNQYIETHNYYDKYGNLRKSVDGRGYESQTEYSADYACAYPTKTISPVPDPSNVNGSSAALETIISYDLNTGLPRYTIDPNNQITEIQYNDSLLRPTKAIAPNGQQTVTQYGAATSAATRFVKNKTQIDAEKWNEVYTYFDGLGRTIKTQSVDSDGDVFVITNYDRMGRVEEVSNPFRNVSNPSCATNLECTSTTYDDFGRVWKVRTPDGAIVETTYALATAGAQIGTVTTVKDQSLRERRSITNGLGQLTRVDEPDEAGQLGAIQSPNQPTVYAYDTLNNLKSVTQGAQTRTFVYDALARLKSATNPESGTINYSYDAAGNLLAKTDARGVLTSYAYDPLNRIVARAYGNEPGGQTPTPAVAYFYDNIQNAKGKLVKVSNSLSTTEYTAFDISGRPAAHRQTTDGQSYTTAYEYNLAGALLAETYPTGRVVKNILNADGELSTVQSKKNQNAGFWTYAAHFTYTAAGAVSSMRLGNGHWESTAFNSRLQPVRIALGATRNASDLLKLDFTYSTPNAADNNGNVRAQSITVPAAGGNPGFTAIQSYTYDSLNRIKQASEIIDGAQTWKQTFKYDRYGNRNFDTTGNQTTTLESGSLPKVVNPEIQASNNRFKTDQDSDGTADYLYDASGNTTRDALNRSFVYDGENKQIEVLENNVSVGKYFYDGDGRRVKKITANETVIFVYDAIGKLIAEYSTQISVAPQVAYLTTDHLGSPRINTDALGSVISRHDYQPFGEEIERASYGTDDIRKQFTGYERDKETDLDFAQARMYANRLGRFTTPDAGPFTPADPQNLNRYPYVLNSPLKFTDPTGNNIELTGDETQAFIDYLEKKTGLKLKYTSKNGVTTITGASKDKNFTGKANEEFANLVKEVAGADGTAKFHVDSGNSKIEGLFFDDNGAAFEEAKVDSKGNKNIRPGNVNMNSINSVDGQESGLAMALVGHFLIEGLEMRETGANYELGSANNDKTAHNTGLEAERKILSEALGVNRTEAKRHQSGIAITNTPVSFVYTTVQYDITVKNDGSATVNKVSPPTVKRPNK